MKRSEAVEEIRKILALNGKDNGMAELEEALLHTMEVLGMLPTQTSDPINHYNQDALQCLTKAYHKWEPEDDLP